MMRWIFKSFQFLFLYFLFFFFSLQIPIGSRTLHDYTLELAKKLKHSVLWKKIQQKASLAQKQSALWLSSLRK